MRVFAQPGRAKQGKFALDVGVKSLDFFDDFFKIPYPLPKLDMISITEFAMGKLPWLYVETLIVNKGSWQVQWKTGV